MKRTPLKSKTWLRILICVLMLTTLTSIMALTVHATAANTVEGVEINIRAAETDYGANESIPLEITLINHNYYAVENVQLQAILPEGLLFDTNSMQSTVISLAPGETVQINNLAVVSDPSFVPPLHTDGNGSDELDLIETLKTVTTIVIVAIIGIAALVGIVKAFKKNSTKMFCGILALGILATSLPMVVFAEADDGYDEETFETTYVSETVEAAAQTELTVDGVDYVIAAKASWDVLRAVNPDNVETQTYSRGEWITLLAEHFGISPMPITTQSDCFYGDTLGTAYGPLAEAFRAHNLLPEPDSEGYTDATQDVPLFEADKIVTREFAAVTIARAMGYQGEYTLEMADVTDVLYENEVSVAVMQGFFTLTDGYFDPKAALSVADKALVFAKLEKLDAESSDTTTEQKNEMALQPGVVQITGLSASTNTNPEPQAQTDGTEESAEEPFIYTAELNEDGTYTVLLTAAAVSGPIAAGTVLTLPSSNKYPGGIALKAAACSLEPDGNLYRLLCTVPEIEEVVTEFEYAGSATVDVDRIQNEEGVTVEYDPNGSVTGEDDTNLSTFEVGNTVRPLKGTLKSTLYEKEIGNTGIKVSGTLEFEMPALTVRAGGRVGLFSFRLDHCSVVVDTETDVSVELSYDFGVPENNFDLALGNYRVGTGKMLLHTIPIHIWGGLCLDLQIFVNFDLKGTATLTFELESSLGVEYRSGAFRLINDFDVDYEEFKLNAKASLGAGLAANLSLFSVFPLVGIDAHAGIAAEVEYIPHIDVNPTLHCGEGAIYLYATLEMNEDTLVFGLLKKNGGLMWSWEIFNKDNTPWKRSMHFENGQRVEECTYGLGDILGVVKDAETGDPIGGARVKLYRLSDGAEVASAISKWETTGIDTSLLYTGEFLIENMPVGLYRMDVQASQYKMYSIQIEVEKDQRVICETALMLVRDHMTSTGVVYGTVKDALTGLELSGTEYAVRQGWNTQTGDTVQAGSISGSTYELTLDPGHYTIEISKDGYVTGYVNVAVISDQSVLQNVTVTPDNIGMDGSGLRIVLTWGATPSDLDSHLYKYSASGTEEFHIWYSDKDHYDSSNNHEANLDVDDTTSYGPETSTVYFMDDDAIYQFYVHDYSDRSSESSTAMSNSGAQVRLYSGDVLIATFNIQENRGGTLWHVFTYNAATNQVIRVNEITYSYTG